MKTADEKTKQLGKEILQSALLGGGLSAGAAGLYHLINGAQSADVPEIGTRLSTGAVPTKKKKRLGREAPSSATAYLLNTYKRATIDPSQMLGRVQELIGSIAAKRPALPFPVPTGAADIGWRHMMNLAAGGIGAYGGLQAVNSIADAKRKEDLKDSVDDARKEYFDALTGKNEKMAYLQEWFDYLKPRFNKTLGDYAVAPALAAALGSGLIGGTYMYGQTKARTKAENLRRAAAARARLQSLQQTPWVDPAELAALTKK